MTSPILAIADQSATKNFMANLPSALLIHAEEGLDTELLIQSLVDHEPSDVFPILPEAEKSQIGVQQIRDLIYKLRTYAERRRVVVINPATLMNEESQNALLKILEEPSDRLHFILASTDKAHLLDTIISRCQIFNLHRTSSTQDNSVLQDSPIDAKSKQQILFLANGRPALIRKLMTNPSLLEQYKNMAACAKKIIQTDPYESLVAAQMFNSSREEALLLVDVLLTLARFQIKSNGLEDRTKLLLNKIEFTEEMLRANGNIKLSLSQLVVQ